MTCLLSIRRRHAFTLLEVIAVTALLGTVLGMAVQVLATAKRHAQAAERQTIALRTVENCLERMTSLAWDEIETAAIEPTLLPEGFIASWPQTQLTGEVATIEEPLEAKQITLRLSLSSASRAPAVHLTAWVYRQPRP